MFSGRARSSSWISSARLSYCASERCSWPSQRAGLVRRISPDLLRTRSRSAAALSRTEARRRFLRSSLAEPPRSRRRPGGSCVRRSSGCSTQGRRGSLAGVDAFAKNRNFGCNSTSTRLSYVRTDKIKVRIDTLAASLSPRGVVARYDGEPGPFGLRSLRAARLQGERHARMRMKRM